MENTLSPTDGGRQLATSATPAVRIGRVDYRGLSVTAKALMVTYEQKMSVSGYIAPTTGVTIRGTGGVYGAGGKISTHNESVATVVYVDRDGVENTAELPSDTSVREGSVFRMDHLNGHRFAVRNISGNQPVRWLRGAGSFISMPEFKKWYLLLIIMALLNLWKGDWEWFVVLAAWPAWVLGRRAIRQAEIRSLNQYMATITR